MILSSFYTVGSLMSGVLALIMLLVGFQKRKELLLKRFIRFWVAYGLSMIAFGIDWLLRNALRAQFSFVYALFWGLGVMYFTALVLYTYTLFILELTRVDLTSILRKTLFVVVFLPLYLFIPVMKYGGHPDDLQLVFQIFAVESGLLVAGMLGILIIRRANDPVQWRQYFLPLCGFAIGQLLLSGWNYFDGGMNELVWPVVFYIAVGLYGIVGITLIVKEIQWLVTLQHETQPVSQWQWALVIDPELIELYKISEREKEIAEAVLQGMTNTEIASEKCIALSTVKKHISNLFLKTKVRNRVELIRVLQNNK